MNLDKEIIKLLREKAKDKESVNSLVSLINEKLGPKQSNALVVLRYFMEAFGLSLSQVRCLEGAECLGNKAYDDVELENILQPLIQRSIN